LVDTRRVDQNEPGVLKAGFGDLVGRAVLGRYREQRLAGERIQERAFAGAYLAEGRNFHAAILELGGEFLDVLHLLFDAGALLRAQARILRELAQGFDGIGQYRLVFHTRAFPGYGARSNRSAGAPAGACARRSKVVSAVTSLDGRRTSTRTAPRASSISRSTGMGAAAAQTT